MTDILRWSSSEECKSWFKQNYTLYWQRMCVFETSTTLCRKHRISSSHYHPHHHACVHTRAGARAHTRAHTHRMGQKRVRINVTGSHAQPGDCHMSGERSKATANSTRSHFFKVQHWEEAEHGGKLVCLWSPLEQKQNDTLKWKVIDNGWKGDSFFEFFLFGGRGWRGLRRKINSEMTIPKWEE